MEQNNKSSIKITLKIIKQFRRNLDDTFEVEVAKINHN